MHDPLHPSRSARAAIGALEQTAFRGSRAARRVICTCTRRDGGVYDVRNDPQMVANEIKERRIVQ